MKHNFFSFISILFLKFSSYKNQTICKKPALTAMTLQRGKRQPILQMDTSSDLLGLQMIFQTNIKDIGSVFKLSESNLLDSLSFRSQSGQKF